MSKTNFINGDASQGLHGTRVVAEFLNTVNNHHHTGLDEDGHGALPYAADTGSVNAYVVALNPALTQYVAGMPIYFKAANANTGASTINVNGLGTVAIKKKTTQDLAAGDIQSGQIIMIVYDGVNFQLIGTLDADTVDGYHASATPASNTIVVGNASGKLAAGWGGAANTLATLNASGLVVENPANATTTPTVNKIPIADQAGGRLAWGWMPSIPSARVTATAQSIPTGGGYTTVNYDTVQWDTHGYFDTVNHRYLPLVSGKYLVIANMKVATANSTWVISLQKNGGYVIIFPVVGDLNTYLTISDIVSVNGTTDYINVGLFQNSGAALNTLTSVNSFITCTWVGQ